MPTIRCRCVRFHSYGDPVKVTQLECTDVDTSLKPTEVLVRWMLSTVLPADINLVQNVYWKKRPPPAYFGSEGVGIVEKAGSEVKSLQVGDHVICLDTAHGLWIEYQAVEEQNLYKFDKRVDLLTAATFSWGLRTINIVRDRQDIADLKVELKTLGADHVFTEEEFKRDGRKFVASLDRPLLLALNGVGGRSALGLAASLSYGGTMVTYGGMSKQPHQITTSALVFNGVQVRGVAMGFTLMQPKNAGLRTRIFDELQQLCIEGKLHGQKADIHPMKDFKTALKRAMAGKHRKQMISLSPPDAASRL